MSGKRTTAHAAHISGFQVVPLTMRRDSALFNVGHVRGIAGLFIRELIRQLAADQAVQNGWNWMIIYTLVIINSLGGATRCAL